MNFEALLDGLWFDIKEKYANDHQRLSTKRDVEKITNLIINLKTEIHDFMNREKARNSDIERLKPLGLTSSILEEDGLFLRFQFPNGYGASVVSTYHPKYGGSYGGRNGLFELAVTKDNKVYYKSPITSDVIGHLTFEEMIGVIKTIKALPEVQNETNSKQS